MLPGCDLYAVAGLSAEFVLQVVNYDGLTQVSAHFAQIFNVKDAAVDVYSIGVMPVEPVGDELPIPIEVVQDLVSIVLLACSED